MSKVAYLALVSLFVFLIPAVSSYNLLLYPKNYTTGQITDSSKNANILLWGGNQAQAFCYQCLKPRTSYTIIYVGDQTHNDVPYATCLRKFRTSLGGGFNIAQEFNYEAYLDDNRQQKIWIVRSEDVGCISRRFLAWRPEEYLFHTQTI